MKPFNTTTLTLFIALALTVVLGGVYAFLFAAMKDKTTATAELSANSEALSGKESRITAARGALKGESANIERLSGYFIKESEIVGFTQKIEMLGAESGTKLSLEALDPGIGESGGPVLTLRITATGGFSNVMRLIGLLENFPAKFELKTVDLSRNEAPLDAKAPKAALWSVAISLTALNFIPANDSAGQPQVRP